MLNRAAGSIGGCERIEREGKLILLADKKRHFSRSSYLRIDVGGVEQIKRDGGEKIDGEPSFEVVECDASGRTHHLAALVHVGRAKVQNYVCNQTQREKNHFLSQLQIGEMTRRAERNKKREIRSGEGRKESSAFCLSVAVINKDVFVIRRDTIANLCRRNEID